MKAVFKGRSFTVAVFLFLAIFLWLPPAFAQSSGSGAITIAAGRIADSTWTGELPTGAVAWEGDLSADVSFEDETISIEGLADLGPIFARNEKRFRRGVDEFTWIGKIDSQLFGLAAFAKYPGGLTALIQLPGRTFHLTKEADRPFEVLEVSTDSVGSCAGQVESQDPKTPIAEPVSGSKDDGSFIDVMIVYSQPAYGSIGNKNAEAQLVIDLANWSYEKGGIDQRLRLVHVTQDSYVEAPDMSDDLHALSDTSDGDLDSVHALRDQYGADLVGLWVLTSNACGIAYVMRVVDAAFEEDAFSVTTRPCTWVWGYAHEIGHNMGVNHDWFVDSHTTPFNYAHGYTYIHPSGLCLRSIMAYPDYCTAQGKLTIPIPLFANPNLQVLGEPFGVPETDSDPADVTQVFNNTAYTVANFRQSVCDCAIAGGCFDDGDPDPDNPCQVCDSALDNAGWTALDQVPCDDDGLFCNGAEICVQGQCTSAGSPCDQAESCDEELDQCLDEPADDDDDTTDDDDDVTDDDDTGDDDAVVDDDELDQKPTSGDDDDDDGCGC